MEDWKGLTDEKLAWWVRSRDKEAYAEVIRRYQARLRRYAAYLLRDADAADDLVQETFIKAYVNLYGFKTSKKFSSWIYRIAHNTAMTYLKKQKRTTTISEAELVADKTDIEKHYDKKQLLTLVKECLGDLPAAYAEVLELYFLEEKSYQEISDILWLPMGTVATRLNRGKGLMARLCQKKQI